MSMNLCIKVDGEKLSVFQTPSYITYMCLVDSDGRIKEQLKGKKAMRAVYAYLLWIESRHNRVYETSEAAMQTREEVGEYRASILKAVQNYKKLEVYSI